MADLNDDTTGNRTPTPVAEPSSRPHVEIGEVIDERYKIASFLGEGGMAMVFQVERLFFNDLCAMKVGKHTFSQVSGQRFRKEAIAACSLEHPNLLRIYDFGIIKEQYPYFVMDFVDGKTLSRYLKKNGPLSLPLALEIFTQVCDGMAHAHRKGIVHRDLKPGNIMIIDGGNSSPRVKVLDFGLAKLLEDASDQSLTRPGDVFGSPLYMSPEQCAGTEVDHRTDIYSFGCMLFEALTGRTPFSANSSIETMVQHREKAPPTLQQARSGNEFPAALEELITRLLSKTPDDRPNNFDDVIILLKAACHDSAPYAVNTSETEESLPPAPAVPNSLKTKLLWTAAVASVLAIGALFCLFVMELAFPNREMPISPPCAPFGSPLALGDGKLNTKSTKTPHSKVRFYSKIVEKNGVREKVFTFPPETYLGELYVFTSSYKRDAGWRARDTVKIPYDKQIGLRVLGDVIDDTSLLRGFRANDLRELLFLKPAMIDDSCIKNIAHLSELRGLEFELSELSDASLPRIDKAFTKLDRLTLSSSSKLSAEAVAKMKIIHNLDNFKIGGIMGGGKIVRKLISEAKTHPTRLNYLSATDTDMVDSDLENIEALSALRILYIRKNPLLTEKVVSHIVKCKKLRDVDLREIELTPRGGNLLVKCRSLEKVTLNPRNWTEQQKQALKESAPKIKFDFRAKMDDLSESYN